VLWFEIILLSIVLLDYVHVAATGHTPLRERFHHVSPLIDRPLPALAEPNGDDRMAADREQPPQGPNSPRGLLRRITSIRRTLTYLGHTGNNPQKGALTGKGTAPYLLLSPGMARARPALSAGRARRGVSNDVIERVTPKAAVNCERSRSLFTIGP